MHEALQQQFVQQFVRCQNRVYAYILTLIGNRSDAEELFQQTTLILWKKWEQFDPQQNFVSWACGIAHHEVRNYLRKHERRNQQLSLHLSLEIVDEIAETVRQNAGLLEERSEALAACIAKLPPHDQRLLDVCYVQGKAIQEAAEELGKSPNALYKSLRKIRWVLYQCVLGSLSAEVR